MKALFSDTFEYKLIYVLRIHYDTHKGLLKIGEATLKTDLPICKLTPNCSELNKAAKHRINQYTGTAGIKTELLYTELAVKEVKKEDGTSKLVSFKDHDVHDVLKKSGNFPQKPKGSETGIEWYKVDLSRAKSAIKAVKEGKENLSGEKSVDFVPIDFRPEQLDAIEQTQKQFKAGDKMLWNAKMRFGKTLTALELIKRMKFKKTIIITHRPVVNEGWYQDFSKIFGDPDLKEEYVYGSKSNGYDIDELIKMNKPFVYFASIQDLRGSEAVGGKYDKNSDAFSVNWDLVIVDEAHEGTTTALGDSVIKNIVKENSGYKTKFLALSGTPFNILGNYENSIYTWDYIMEQQAKSDWAIKHFGDSNPYSELPTLKIFTYDLGKLLSGEYVDIEDKAFNFKEFFRVKTNEDNKNEEERFYHESDIRSFLDLLTKEDKNSNYPYSNKKYRDLFKHSLWVVPGVKEAKALSKMMRNHPVFGCGEFNIVNVAGEGDDEAGFQDALRKVKDAIENSDGKYTITLSCGRLTTGVTVPQWTAVFMLAGSFSTSASSYLQTIFRVQSPCNENGKVKTCGYVFDFAPDRTLKMVAESVAVSSKAGKTDNNDRAIMGEFLNYCPVISVYGSEMKRYDTDRLLQQLKRAYAERAVKNGFDDTSLYNDELLKLDELDIEKFDGLKKIVGTSKASSKTKDIDINSQGLTDEEYEVIKQIEKKKPKERTPEEIEMLEKIKEQKKQRGNAISILRAISIRMPLLIYGTDVNIDEDITIEKLVEEVDDASWEEFMPKGVTKSLFREFIKYYDPDIFVAAGKRIRNIVKSADELEPTERIKKITELFSCFKNPDKETVLTPWRVVNLHISDCLGGYDFYDEKHTETIDVPRYVNQGKVTEDTLSNTDAKILEINSKSGLYPLYAAYSIYRARCKKYKPQELTSETKNKLWEETVKNNIFVICKTPMAKYITKRTLVGFKKASINAHYFDDLLSIIKNKPKLFIMKVKNPNYWGLDEGGTMKFDAVIGNPPYMEMDGGAKASAKPIYQYFVSITKKLNSQYLSFIMPTRWYAGGKGLDEFRDEMLNDMHIEKLFDCLSPEAVFPNTNIRGGVCYFLRNSLFDNQKELVTVVTKEKEGDNYITVKRPLKIKGLDIFIRYSQAVNILNKVSALSKETLNTYVSSRRPFGIDANIIKSNQFKSSKFDGSVKCLGKGQTYGYISKSLIKQHLDWIENWKLFTPRANNIGTELSDDNLNCFIGEPETICTESYIMIGTNMNLDEEKCKKLSKYLMTKFARFMHSIAKASQDATSKTYRFVPMQDFTPNSDIDWSKSVSEIDRQLYAKYNLSEDEIAFIEEKIKPME